VETKLVELLTTDGNAVFRVSAIVGLVEQNRDDTTCMLHTIDGKSYEVSGNLDDIARKIREAD
jgi:hypothetical protein